MKPEIMLDLETMGIGPDAAIVAIGAALFDSTGICEEFYRRVDLASAIDGGGVMDAGTVLWWMQRSEAARREIYEGDRDHINVALLTFAAFCPDDALVWGNGAAFDNVVLRGAYQRAKLPTPFHYRNDRCFRTVRAMSDVPWVEVGTHHNALDDAKAQALTLLEIRKALAK